MHDRRKTGRVLHIRSASQNIYDLSVDCETFMISSSYTRVSRTRYGAATGRRVAYAEMGTVGDGSSFLSACACAIRFCASVLRSSISFTFLSSSAAVVGVPSGRLNVTLLLWLAPPMEPVSGVGTLTVGLEVDSPRWKVVGSTRPSGCWYVQVARVQAAPNLQAMLAWLAGRGWANVQPGRVQLAPNLHGTLGCDGAEADGGM